MTVKSQDNCADLGKKTLTPGTLSLLRKQSITISPGESRMLRASALEVLERTLDEIARSNRVTEKMMSGLEGSRQLEVIMT